MWEHSYYIDFRNKRPGYLANFLGKAGELGSGRGRAVSLLNPYGACERTAGPQRPDLRALVP